MAKKTKGKNSGLSNSDIFGDTSDDTMDLFMRMLGSSLQIPDDYGYDEEAEERSHEYSEFSYPDYLPSRHIAKYTLRVTLKNPFLKIFRKFECPSNITLRHLTELMISLMGWNGSHLNQITLGRYDYFIPFYQDQGGWYEKYYQEEHRISDILVQKGKTAVWEYDFGDSWIHEIRLSSVSEYKMGEPHNVVFKGGSGACPPEDCGGVYGYGSILEILDKVREGKSLTDEEKERLELFDLQDNFNPEYCDESVCNLVCKNYGDRTYSDKEKDNEDKSEEKYKSKDKDKESVFPESPIYDQILGKALLIRKHAPWVFINDSLVYTIRMSDGSDVYIATMGYGGETYEIQMYDGVEEFQLYLFLSGCFDKSGYDINDEYSWSSFRTISYLHPKDEVMEPHYYEQLDKRIKANKFKRERTKGYPFIQKILPHRIPTLNIEDEGELLRIKEIVDAIEWFSERIKNSNDLPALGFERWREYATDKGGKVVPLIVRTSDGYQISSTKLPGRINDDISVILPQEKMKPLRELKKKGTYYCRLIHLPGFVESEDDKENSYAALFTICVDSRTKEPNNSEPCTLSDDMYLAALEKLAEKFIKNGTVPKKIVVDNERTRVYLKGICEELGIKLEFKETAIQVLDLMCTILYARQSFGDMFLS